MIGILLTAAISIPNHGVSCKQLQTLDLPDTTITSTEEIAAGPVTVPEASLRFHLPSSPAQPAQPVPAHCQVKMVLTPTPDSRINVELWLPVENWNGKFMAVGNGGWAGEIQGYPDMLDALQRGYATAANDTGHADSIFSGMFALGHPEKIVDFAYRAMHLMTVRSKQLIDAYYPTQLNYSYYNGCSTGGRQGVMSAQRYPGDFDGIIAGDMANRHIHMHTSGVAQSIYLSRHPEAAISETTAKMVSEAVMNKCDTLKEGFLNDPRQCSFDFATLQCKGTATDSCLTSAQLKTVETYYGGVRNSKGELIFSGYSLGIPIPAQLSTNEEPGAFPFDTVRILGFQDAEYDWHKFNLDRDMPRIDAAAGFVDAVNPDLQAFKAAGGKLILYHGWSDPGITPENTIYYFNSVLKEMGKDQDDWMRLFMVPGMLHCGGGDGPNAFDSISALEKWSEKGDAPESIMATNPESGLSRPLCPYPESAKYDGTGDLKDASNWSCTTPR